VAAAALVSGPDLLLTGDLLKGCAADVTATNSYALYDRDITAVVLMFASLGFGFITGGVPTVSLSCVLATAGK
jgi:hypothetical protein